MKEFNQFLRDLLIPARKDENIFRKHAIDADRGQQFFQMFPEFERRHWRTLNRLKGNGEFFPFRPVDACIIVGDRALLRGRSIHFARRAPDGPASDAPARQGEVVPGMPVKEAEQQPAHHDLGLIDAQFVFFIDTRETNTEHARFISGHQTVGDAEPQHLLEGGFRVSRDKIFERNVFHAGDKRALRWGEDFRRSRSRARLWLAMGIDGKAAPSNDKSGHRKNIPRRSPEAKETKGVLGGDARDLLEGQPLDRRQLPGDVG
ncbi:hypothetical protein [Rhodocaloribacter sp.]